MLPIALWSISYPIGQLAESKLAMMEANEKQLRQRQERLSAEKEEENRLVQIMLDKFKVLSTHRGSRRVTLASSPVYVFAALLVDRCSC